MHSNKKMWEAEQARFASHCNSKKLSPQMVYKEAKAAIPVAPNAQLKASLKAKARVHPSLAKEPSMVESDSGSSSEEEDDEDDDDQEDKKTADVALESFGSSFNGSMSPA
jgi:hypothetical protein